MLKWWSNRQGLKKPGRLLIYTKKLITSILWIYMVFVMGKVTYPILILCLSSLAMAAWGLGCTETPFLASCQCRTHVGHQNGYESPDFDVRWVSSFFFFLLTRINVEPTRPKRQQWRKKKKKITDFEFEKSFWETHLSKFSTHPRSDLCRCPLSLAGARSGWSASSIDVEWCRALSLMAISLYLGVDNRSDPLSFFFFFFLDINFGVWMVMDVLSTVTHLFI